MNVDERQTLELVIDKSDDQSPHRGNSLIDARLRILEAGTPVDHSASILLQLDGTTQRGSLPDGQ